MRRILCVLCVLVALGFGSGCASIFESLVDSAVGAAFGESSEEGSDRQKMEEYRKHWSTPGRMDSEIEEEARGTFRRKHGREPNLNWHVR